MRLDTSTDAGRAAYDALPKPVRIFFDGNEMDNGLISLADDETGLLRIAVTDKDRQIFVRRTPHEVCTVDLYGTVHIRTGGADLGHEVLSQMWRINTLPGGSRAYADGLAFVAGRDCLIS